METYDKKRLKMLIEQRNNTSMFAAIKMSGGQKASCCRNYHQEIGHGQLARVELGNDWP
jgi:hypothetical protein